MLGTSRLKLFLTINNSMNLVSMINLPRRFPIRKYPWVSLDKRNRGGGQVSPVLDHQTEIQEPINVGYFAIEIVSDDKQFDEPRFNDKSSSSFSNKKIPMGVVG